MLPSKVTRPIAPPYQRRADRSFSSIKRIAQSFGAPVTVTAQAWLKKAVEGVEFRAQFALDMIDRVDQP